ncbi:MAG: hypothetical protein KAT29_15275, partial [Anaerolineales bacterium]|nr:hypothetical protein [Anaerolineales bacterium]
PLPEAPASVNFKGVTKAGFVCQWTLRDVDESALLNKQVAFMQMLGEGGVVPYGRATTQPEGNDKPVSANTPDDDPGWCKIHDCKLYENTGKDGSKWWSHKTDDPAYSTGFCKGKPAK